MTRTPPPVSMPQSPAGTTREAVSEADENKARVFPCESCGADLEFSIGQQSLECPYCGHIKQIQFEPDAAVSEQDFHTQLQRLAELRDGGRLDETGCKEVKCENCGSTVRFTGTLTSSECAYCGVPLQLDKIHDASHRVPVDGVLPFLIDRQRAQQNLSAWVESRWFAPNDFRASGVQGKFNGIYLPYWTFDTLTTTHYTGERGEHYWVTVGSGKNRRRVRRTRWYPAAGTFQRFFDDVLTIAASGVPTDRLEDLEPWPLHKATPFKPEMLAGFLARTYDVELDEGFVDARQRIDRALYTDVKRHIGGDTQRVHSVQTQYDAITYKHLLLPVWMLTYRYQEKPYQVVVNAGTGEVQGDRPYSWVKITLAILLACAVAGIAAYFINMQ